MKKSFLVIFALAILSACQPPMTREQELAIYRSRCLDYGFRMGTVEFARCMQEQEAREDELSMQARKIEAIKEQNWIAQENVRVKKDKYEMERKKQKKDKKRRG